jgi:hypothetical protein
MPYNFVSALPVTQHATELTKRLLHQPVIRVIPVSSTSTLAVAAATAAAAAAAASAAAAAVTSRHAAHLDTDALTLEINAVLCRASIVLAKSTIWNLFDAQYSDDGQNCGVER